MSHFSWSTRSFPSVAAFVAYLATLPPPRWAQGVAIHHTWSPDVQQWAGARTMAGLARYYQFDVRNPDGSRGWSSGPHLFIAPDGVIWQGTPVTTPGTHAGTYNRLFWGIEVVGNYDVKPWSTPTAEAAFGAATALLRWKGITTIGMGSVRGHRETGSSKTCPGKQINMDAVRAELWKRLTQRPTTTYRVRAPLATDPADDFAAVREGRGRSYPIALAGTARLSPGTLIEVDDVTDGWAHIAKSSPVYGDVGFVAASLLERVG
jgi:hypothetical protein